MESQTTEECASPIDDYKQACLSFPVTNGCLLRCGKLCFALFFNQSKVVSIMPLLFWLHTCSFGDSTASSSPSSRYASRGSLLMDFPGILLFDFLFDFLFYGLLRRT